MAKFIMRMSWKGTFGVPRSKQFREGEMDHEWTWTCASAAPLLGSMAGYLGIQSLSAGIQDMSEN